MEKSLSQDFSDLSKRKSKGLFIFRRDLRTVDNTTFSQMRNLCETIYPIFIFTPEQIGSQNEYKSDICVQFMIESLIDLDKQLNGKLCTLYGDNNTVIRHCISEWDIDLVGFNIDISPYAKKRDQDIIDLCKTANVSVLGYHDYYLHQPGTIVNGSGETYQKFTPYYETAQRIKIHPPEKSFSFRNLKKGSLAKYQISLKDSFRFCKKAESMENTLKGGRLEGLKQLNEAKQIAKHYSTTHDELAKPTTQLSAYIKFGCISIREVKHALGSNHALIRQLHWRDFYASILNTFPRVLGHALKPRYDEIKWKNNSNWFEKWCSGKTGYPIVDAGMTELNTTGFMHNRARLIVASFLVKTLQIDWRKGEKYFAQHLIDYDPASNNGNWQWIAGSGADSQPYFRIFNPWEQAKHHDPDCEYIKKWLPFLEKVPKEDILNWNVEHEKYKDVYCAPIVDYFEQKEKVLKMYT